MEKNSDLSATFVRSILDYDPETGIFRWKRRHDIKQRSQNATPPGSIASSRQIMINGRQYRSSRLAWLVMTGEWPDEVDHRDLDESNNRFVNLRAATHGEAMRNRGIYATNTSGYKGASLNRKTGRWRGYIYINKKQIWLGTFDTPEAAHAAYCAAAQKIHGEFARFA